MCLVTAHYAQRRERIIGMRIAKHAILYLLTSIGLLAGIGFAEVITFAALWSSGTATDLTSFLAYVPRDNGITGLYLTTLLLSSSVLNSICYFRAAY